MVVRKQATAASPSMHGGSAQVGQDGGDGSHTELPPSHPVGDDGCGSHADPLPSIPGISRELEKARRRCRILGRPSAAPRVGAEVSHDGKPAISSLFPVSDLWGE